LDGASTNTDTIVTGIEWNMNGNLVHMTALECFYGCACDSVML